MKSHQKPELIVNGRSGGIKNTNRAPSGRGIVDTKAAGMGYGSGPGKMKAGGRKKMTRKVSGPKY